MAQDIRLPGLLAYGLRLGELLDRHLSRALRARNIALSRSQTEVIILLYRKGALDMGALSRELQKDPGTMTSVVAGLVDRKLCLKRSGKDDRRTNYLELTAEGRNQAKRCLVLYRKLEKKLQKIAPDSIEPLAAILGALVSAGLAPYPARKDHGN
mgnify:CR=1 FL=1